MIFDCLLQFKCVEIYCLFKKKKKHKLLSNSFRKTQVIAQRAVEVENHLLASLC